MAQNPTITKCLVGEARMNFAHVFTPDSFDDKSEPKYSVILAFPKSDKALYNKVQKAIDECVEKAKAKYGGALPKKFNVIEIVDGDDWDEKFDLSEYYTLKASSSYTLPQNFQLQKELQIFTCELPPAVAVFSALNRAASKRWGVNTHWKQPSNQ